MNSFTDGKPLDQTTAAGSPIVISRGKTSPRYGLFGFLILLGILGYTLYDLQSTKKELKQSQQVQTKALEEKLTEMADECASRPVCVQIDRVNNKVLASAIFSWREAEFSAAYGGSAGAAFASRSPIERSILSFVERRLMAAERQFLAQNAFQMAYQPFDWSLNDLTGRGGR